MARADCGALPAGKMLGSIFCRVPVPAPEGGEAPARSPQRAGPRAEQRERPWRSGGGSRGRSASAAAAAAAACRVEELLLFRLSRCLQCRSSVLQDRDLTLASDADAVADYASTAPEDSKRPRTAPRSRPPASPSHRSQRPPSARPATDATASAAAAAMSSLYGSAQVPDIRISRDPVAAYRESLQVSLRAFRRRQWRPLDAEAQMQPRDPEDIDRRSCSRLSGAGGSRPVSAAGSSARFPVPRRRPNSVPAEALASREASAAARAKEDGAAAASKDGVIPPGQPEAGTSAKVEATDESLTVAAAAAAAAAAQAGNADAEAEDEALPPLQLEDCAPAFTPRFYEWQKANFATEAAPAQPKRRRRPPRRSGEGGSSGGSDSGSSGSQADSDESDSEEETAKVAAAPAAERARAGRFGRRVPLLNLPPEKDPQYLLPSSCLEPDKIEFSALAAGSPTKFEFSPVLPEPFSKASFRSLADCENGWRSVFHEDLAPEPALASLMDRLIAMERMQLDTVRMEGGLRACVADQLRPARAASGGAGRPRSRNCCRGCLQVACAGDCPLKRAPARVCLHCRQPLCLDRACLRRTYAERARGEAPPEQLAPQRQPPQPARHCKPCAAASPSHAARRQRQPPPPPPPPPPPQPLLLSRPRSQLPTYSSSAQGKHRTAETKRHGGRLPAAVNFAEQFKDAMAQSADAAEVTRDQNCFRPSHICSGRNAILPGKCRASMRRHSLTIRRPWTANNAT